MNTNDELPTGWTDKQRAAYAALKAASAKYEAQILNRPSITNNAPKGGWTDADRIAK